MNTDSVEIAKQFCEQCICAYESWITHIKLFDENQNREKTIDKAAGFHDRLQDITQQYSVLQIYKLHDPAESKRHRSTSYNLTIKYMLEYYDWGEDTESIKELAAKLDKLYQHLNLARNKVIAHRDINTIFEGGYIGGFQIGLDVEYFRILEDFANRVYGKWVGVPVPFKDLTLVENDIAEYLCLLEKA